MMNSGRRFPLLPAIIALALLCAAPSLVAHRQADPEKTVFVSVVDASGKPVTDLKTEHFAVAEDNVERKVVSAKLSEQPVSIQLLADTSSIVSTAGQSNLIQDIRKALTSFVDDVIATNPENQVALMEFGQASITIVKSTSKVADLEKGITRLFPKNEGSVLSEAVIQAAGDLQKATTRRRIIVVLNLEPANEMSQENPAKLNDAIKKSGAQLWAVSLTLGPPKNPQHDIVLNALAANTGGRREMIVGQSAMVTWLKTYWTQLSSQYEVTYTRPAATPTARQVNVGLRAQGLKTYFSYYAPQ